MLPRSCECLEGRIAEVNGWGHETGEIIPLPQGHDCRYIERRNALIPLAEPLADIGAPRETPLWDEAFLHAMNELARKAFAARLL